jgi:hypothetical protein
MTIEFAEIHRKGKRFRVPSVRIGSRTVACVGKSLRVASIWDEDWLEAGTYESPELVIAELRRSPLNADVFTFSQRFDEPEPKHPYYFEQDNVAAVSTVSFAAWWDRLPQESRKNVRRSKRFGVDVREVKFDDDLVRGIMAIYNADELRQTGTFWHYGKGFDDVKRDNSSYLDRSCLLGAYSGDELIGFIKMVYVDGAARLMQIVAKTEHRDKRPMNALIAKAVELCEKKGIPYLIYGKYFYGNKTQSSLVEFKHRNGFEPLYYPKYFVPLTPKGRVAVRLRLHRGLLGILPERIITFLVIGRRMSLQFLSRARAAMTRAGGVRRETSAVGGDGK